MVEPHLGGGARTPPHLPHVALAVLALLVVAIVVAACERTLVEPVSVAATPKAAAVWATPGGEDNSPAGTRGPVLAPPDTHSGSQAQASLPGYFKYRTIAQVTYSGAISRHTLFGPFPDTTFGPMGQGGDNGIMWIGQSSAAGGGARAITGLTEIATFQYTINYGRNPSSQPSNDNPACGNVYNWRDCVRFDEASPSTVSYTVFDVGLNSAVTPAATPSHGLVRFDIGPSIDSIGGFHPGVEGAEWVWTPDDTVQYGGSRGIACSGNNHCELFVDYNGTMRARAYTNGIMKEAQPMHVTVTDSVYMTVDKPYGPPGYGASFTVHLDGATGMYINAWWFYADTGGFSRQLTWCGFGSYGTTAGPCGYNIPMSGKVVAEVFLNGSWRSPSKHVIVIPCPTDDSLLDHPETRRMLDSAWDLGRSGTDMNQWRERAVASYDSSGKRIARLLPLDTLATPCSNHIIDLVPAPGRKLMDSHLHPFAINDSLPRACEDSSHHLQPNQYLRYGHKYGGLSGADWEHTTVTNLPVYAFDLDSMYRGMPGTTFEYDSIENRYRPLDWQNHYKAWPWDRRTRACRIARYE